MTIRAIHNFPIKSPRETKETQMAQETVQERAAAYREALIGEAQQRPQRQAVATEVVIERTTPEDTRAARQRPASM